MTTAQLSPTDRTRSSIARGRALVTAILGNIVILGIVAAAALVVPLAAIAAFGPALLSRLS